MNNVSPSQNPPITAAGVTAVIMGLVAAFGSLPDNQFAAIGAAVGLVAAFVAQRFTKPKGIAE